MKADATMQPHAGPSSTTSDQSAMSNQPGGKTGDGVPGEPVLPEVLVNVVTPAQPVVGRVIESTLCTRGRKASGFVRHVAIDVSGTRLAGSFRAGQAFGVVPPGVDERGKPHKLRLYSIASPTSGEDGQGQVIATTVKRTLDEHWETHRLLTGVASNYLCDLSVGDEVQLTGPSGKRFLLPVAPEQHDYVFFATGTGIAPFRGMIKELLAAGVASRIVLVMGVPYTTDLLYDEDLRHSAEQHPNFTYLTAISRDPGPDGAGSGYVQDRLVTHREQLEPMLRSERTLVYVCGIAGMEVGLIRGLAEHYDDEVVSQFVRVSPEAGPWSQWDRRAIGRSVRATGRLLLEVY